MTEYQETYNNTPEAGIDGTSIARLWNNNTHNIPALSDNEKNINPHLASFTRAGEASHLNPPFVSTISHHITSDGHNIPSELIEDYQVCIESIINNNNIVILSKDNCKFCDKSYNLLNNKNIKYFKFNISLYIDDELFDSIYDQIMSITNNAKSYPMIFIEKKYIGGFNQLNKYIRNKELQESFINEDF
jgi:glutaredoxin